MPPYSLNLTSSTKSEMEEIRKALLQGQNIKLNRKEYQFVIELEKKRLFYELVAYTILSFLVGVFLFFSLFFEIKYYSWLFSILQTLFQLILKNDNELWYL